MKETKVVITRRLTGDYQWDWVVYQDGREIDRSVAMTRRSCKRSAKKALKRYNKRLTKLLPKEEFLL